MQRSNSYGIQGKQKLRPLLMQVSGLWLIFNVLVIIGVRLIFRQAGGEPFAQNLSQVAQIFTKKRELT